MKRAFKTGTIRRPRQQSAKDHRIVEVVDAVCDELGIDDRNGRALIASRILAAYARGARQPLNLVDAGLAPRQAS